MITSKQMRAIEKDTLVRSMDSVCLIKIGRHGINRITALFKNCEHELDKQRDYSELWFLSKEDEANLKSAITKIIKQ